MLVLTKRLDDSVVIGDDIKITVLTIGKKQIKLWIQASYGKIINMGLAESIC